MEVTREVVNRDGMWVVFTQFGLLIFLFQPRLHWWMGALALLAYCGYVLHLYVATRRFRSQLESGEVESGEPDETASFFFGRGEIKLTGLTSTIILISATLLAAFACYLLVELTNQSAEKLHVPSVLYRCDFDRSRFVDPRHIHVTGLRKAWRRLGRGFERFWLQHL